MGLCSILWYSVCMCIVELLWYSVCVYVHAPVSVLLPMSEQVWMLLVENALIVCDKYRMLRI